MSEYVSQTHELRLAHPLIFMKAFLFTCLVFSTTMTAALAQSMPTEPPISTLPNTDYAGAIWTPAAEGSFDPANRPVDQPIDLVIIHDIEGSAQSAINIFQTPGSQVSAHYVVGGDGRVYQLVREHDIGWHAGNPSVNRRSIGIEHAGFAYRPGYYNGAEYEASAKLVRDITTRYNIPRDRAHIIGHDEVPHPDDPTKFGGRNGHTDPGPYWDWNVFMALLRNDARLQNAALPSTIHPGEVVPASVTFTNTGDDAWPANLAPDPKAGLEASGPLVYLGTSQPDGMSVLAGRDWISPQFAAGLKASDVAPGAMGRFDFMLRGPRALGDVVEEMRLCRVPTIAQGGSPLRFGDTVHIALRVVPWELTVAAPDVPAASSIPVPAPALARWTMALPVGGWWELQVNPARLPGKKATLVYGVTAGNATAAEQKFSLKAQRVGDWHSLGRFRFVEPPPRATLPAIVRLLNAPKGMNMGDAGAIRWVGPFPDKGTP